jgi:hypothetical protein
MKKDFKLLKRDLVLYRHMYLIYVGLILGLLGIVTMTYVHDSIDWYFWLDLSLIAFLLWILCFKIHKERGEIKEKSEIFIKTLMTIQEAMKERKTRLLVLNTEFDELKNKENGVKLIQDRIAKIHFSSIERSIEFAIKNGGEPQPFVSSIAVPDSISELKELVDDMLVGSEKESSEVSSILKEVKYLYERF